MAKRPGLLDLVSLVPASDLARAAKVLGIDPESLAKRLLALDSSGLSTKFIDTASRALKPGEAAGRLMLDHASRIFTQARDFTRELEELAGLQAPELHFGTDMFAAQLPLGTALGRMASANSRLRVNCEMGNFEHLAREVLAGRIEFAVADTTSAERHPTKLAIEPVAEHRVFFFVRTGHPLTSSDDHSLETILVFPLVAPRLPPRIGGHLTRAASQVKADRDTGDVLPSVMVDSYAVARQAVLSGDAVGMAPLTALEADLRAGKLTLLPYSAPWLHLSYGLFYTRKKPLSRVAQLFMTQLRQVEITLQEREQRALARLEPRPIRSRRAAPARKGAKAATRKTTARKPQKAKTSTRSEMP